MDSRADRNAVGELVPAVVCAAGFARAGLAGDGEGVGARDAARHGGGGGGGYSSGYLAGSGTTVDYSTTVFGSSYREYIQTVEGNIGSQVYEKTKNKIWNTPLIFEPIGDGNIFHESEKNKGVNFFTPLNFEF